MTGSNLDRIGVPRTIAALGEPLARGCTFFPRFYFKRHTKLQPFDRRELADWLGIMAALRLRERISGERERLLALAAGMERN